jgi:hypothetical protein
MQNCVNVAVAKCGFGRTVLARPLKIWMNLRSDT